MTFQLRFREYLTSALDFIYPPRCSVCQVFLLRKSDFQHLQKSSKTSALSSALKLDEQLNSLFCPWCAPTDASLWMNLSPVRDNNSAAIRHIKPKQSVCSICDEYFFRKNQENTLQICDLCSFSPMSDLRMGIPPGVIRSIWYYTEQIERMILAIKYNGARSLLPYCSHLFLDLINELLNSTEKSLDAQHTWDAIIPIPSTTNSLRNRGFHHMHLISTLLAKKIKIPVLTEAVVPVGNRPRQVTLEIKERHNNMKNGFVVNKRQLRLLPRNARILLLDDVLTTGSTITAVCETLKKTPISRADILTLARSPRFSHHRTVAITDN